jgi:hypothetical protein
MNMKFDDALTAPLQPAQRTRLGFHPVNEQQKMPKSGHPICSLPCLKRTIFSTLTTALWMSLTFWIESRAPRPLE